MPPHTHSHPLRKIRTCGCGHVWCMLAGNITGLSDLRRSFDRAAAIRLL